MPANAGHSALRRADDARFVPAGEARRGRTKGESAEDPTAPLEDGGGGAGAWGIAGPPARDDVDKAAAAAALCPARSRVSTVCRNSEAPATPRHAVYIKLRG